MMRKAIFYLLLVFLVACKNNASDKKEIIVPAAPLSVANVKAEVKNKEYKVNEVGTIDFFNPDELEWSSASGDTSKFFKDYVSERKNFSLHFINDSAVQMQDEKKAIAAHYDLQKDSSGILLKIQYPDSTFSFNPGETMMMTSTFKIRGVDDNGQLLLETPREINRRKVVVLMKGN